MKLKAVFFVCATLFAFQLIADETPVLKTEKDKVSYSLGVSFATSVKSQGAEVDPDMFYRGMQDVLSDREMLLTDDEIRDVLAAFQRGMEEKAKQMAQVEAEKNKNESEAFLAENAKKEGVVVRETGLQYKIITEGNGPKPKETDRVTVHYRGTLVDGSEFDSSYSRNEPVTFNVDGVIPGWTEALQLMNVGSKWQLFIPSSLAYGDRGAGGVIGPNSALVFEVELLSIENEEPEDAEGKADEQPDESKQQN